MSGLNELLAQEQKKAAANTFRLANYYTPFGRIPNQVDFEAMQKHLRMMSEGKATIKELWPEASVRMRENIERLAAFHEQQESSIQALIDAGAERILSDEELFEHGRSQDSTYMRLFAQTRDINGAN